MSKQRAKGTRAETEVVAALHRAGFTEALHAPLWGAHDKGDIVGIPAVISVKNQKTMKLAEWVTDCGKMIDDLYHIGCGSGEVDALVARSFRIVGVDISSEARRLYQKNYPTSEVYSKDIPKSSLTPRLTGIYSLGLVEHFSKSEIVAILKNMKASIISTGRVVLFWPHRRAPSVFILRLATFLRGFFGRNEALHPSEPSLLSSRREVEDLASSAGLDVISYEYGPSDLWIQAAIVLQSDVMEEPESGKSRFAKQVASQTDYGH